MSDYKNETLLEEARREINEVDAQMAELFVRRMRAAEKVAQYKKEHALPILDAAREEQVVQANAKLVEDETLREYYVNFIRNIKEAELERHFFAVLQESGLSATVESNTRR